MISDEQKEAMRDQCISAVSQQFTSAYLSAIGANIHLGEKRARKLACDAGVLAIRSVEQDIVASKELIMEQAQEMYVVFMHGIMSHMEQQQKPGILVPEHHAKGNGIIMGN